MSTKLNKRQQLAATFIAMGETAIAVSKKLKVRPETLSRWGQIEAFQSAVHHAHLKIYEELINQQTNLLKRSQTLILDLFNSSEVTKQIKASLAIRYLQMVGGQSSANEKMQEHLAKHTTAHKETNQELLVHQKILRFFFDIRDAAQSLQGSVFIEKVNQQIANVDRELLKINNDEK